METIVLGTIAVAVVGGIVWLMLGDAVAEARLRRRRRRNYRRVVTRVRRPMVMLSVTTP
jgi:hypothetical protein